MRECEVRPIKVSARVCVTLPLQQIARKPLWCMCKKKKKKNQRNVNNIIYHDFSLCFMFVRLSHISQSWLRTFLYVWGSDYVYYGAELRRVHVRSDMNLNKVKKKDRMEV